MDKKYIEKLNKHGYTIDSFLEEFSSDDYRYTKMDLLDDIYFYIDEFLGYNNMQEDDTFTEDDDDTYYSKLWEGDDL